MRAVIVILLCMVIVGCAHRMTLPQSGFGGCGFNVIDDRPDPDHLYAKGQVIIQIQPIPTIANSVKGAVCSTTDPKLMNGATFTITDFSCMVSGFFKITYIVELRGFLAKGKMEPLEIRAGKKVDSAQSYVPAGCEKAASEVIPLIAQKIHDRLGG